MSAEWPRVTIKSLIDSGIIKVHKDGNYGSRYPRASEFGDKGVAFLTAKLLDESGNIDFASAPRIPEEKAKDFTFGYVKSGDVLLSHNATVGRVAIVPEIQEKALIGTSLTHYRLNTDRLLPKYLAAYFSGQDFQNQLASVMSQTTRNQVPITSQRTLDVVLPPVKEQRAIANLLSCLDDKVKINHQINQTLEQMAQALFKSWFVDFEPVKAKIAARKRWQALQSENEPASPVCYAAEFDEPPAVDDLETTMNRAAMQAIAGKTADQLDALRAEGPERYNELYETAALFPSAMQDSELGEIPEGWGVTNLSSLAEITMGQSPKGDTYNFDGIGVPLVNGPVEFGIRHPVRIKWTTAPSKLSDKHDLIVCVRGSTTGRFVKSDGIYCLGRGVCAIRAVALQPYVDRLFLSELPTLLGLTTGSTFPSWSGPTLKKHRVLVPNESLMANFSRRIAAIDLEIGSRVLESKYLTSLRNTLLPKLLSGELTVPDAEARMAEVADA